MKRYTLTLLSSLLIGLGVIASVAFASDAEDDSRPSLPSLTSTTSSPDDDNDDDDVPSSTAPSSTAPSSTTSTEATTTTMLTPNPVTTSPAPTNPPSTTVPSSTAAPETTVPSTAAPTTTAAPPPTTPGGASGQCAQWYDLAMKVGFTPADWGTLDYIIWRESRCQPSAWNQADPMQGSMGLTQINSFWCLPSRYHPAGWLQEQGVLSSCQDLFDPATSLRATLAIRNYSGGWSPWRM